MTNKITFLGIETSCDETAAAIIRENDKGTADILSNIVSSQIEEHKKFGGFVPELAARAHLENIEYIIDTALKKSKISFEQLDGVAATAGPGLIVCLTVGLNIGKSIAAFSNKPFVGVNHLEGHALSPGLKEKIEFPYLLLLISGGHTQFLIVKDINKYEQLGTTIDENNKLKYNLAASFQNTINKILYKKTKVAANMFKEKTQKENFQLVVAGGVAANESIRHNLLNLSKKESFEVLYPDLKFCGDNAAMIAWAGIQRYKKNLIDDLNIAAKSRWPLDGKAPYMKGPGLKFNVSN
jgi:tRNA A37 threonylcarbamoyltransferase TsaD